MCLHWLFLFLELCSILKRERNRKRNVRRHIIYKNIKEPAFYMQIHSLEQSILFCFKKVWTWAGIKQIVALVNCSLFFVFLLDIQQVNPVVLCFCSGDVCVLFKALVSSNPLGRRWCWNIRYSLGEKNNAFSIKLNIDVLITMLTVRWKDGSALKEEGSKFWVFLDRKW